METPEPGFVISVIVVFLTISYLVYKVTQSPAPPKEKDNAEKYAAAIELLKGGNADEIAAREGISTEELEKWKGEFLENALAYAKAMNDHANQEIQHKKDIEWFEKACEKHIGADWKNITHYDKK